MRMDIGVALVAIAALGFACAGGSSGSDTVPAGDVQDAAGDGGDVRDAIPGDTGREAIENPRIAINEVVNKAASGPDWIELFNPGDAPRDLSGWILKDSDDKHVFAFPAGTVIDASAWKIVEGEGGTSALVTTFGLGKADAVRLFDPDLVPVDSVAWVDGEAPQGTSLGRCPDGHGAFFRLATPTRGTANACP